MGSLKLRTLLAGLLAGVLLSILRAPLGLDLVRVPAVDGATAALFRAAPWIVLAGLFGRPARLFERDGVPVATLLFGATLGVALAAFGLDRVLAPQSRFAAGSAALGLAALIWVCVRRPAGGAAAEPDDGSEAPRFLEWSALLLAGQGCALSLSCVAYHLRHLGLASTAEDSASAFVFAALVAVGAACFAAGWVRGSRARALLAGGLPLAAAAGLVGAGVMHGFTGPGGLDVYLRRFGLDLSLVGTLRYTALIASVVLVAPALATGAALAGARHRMRLAAVLLGAGVGVAAWPIAVDALGGEPRAYVELFDADAPPWTWQRIAGGAWLAAAGG
ncbi:MAG: hypothetical protein AAF682_32355, partial [Planctomycetota bacterium]